MVLSSKALGNVKSKKNDSVERSHDLSNQQNSQSSGTAIQLNVPKRSNSKEQQKSSRYASKDSRDPKEDDANYQKKKEFMLKCILRI